MDSENSAKSALTSKLSTVVFYLSILFFIIGFNFTDVPPGPFWYQQFMPNLNGRNITDIIFIDSLTGWSVTNAVNQNPDTTYVLKTINGGDNWSIQYRKVQSGGGFPGYLRVYFLNQNTGFTCGVAGIDKSTNGGTSWTSLNAPQTSYLDMSILNVDTIWSVSSDPIIGGVFRTTNGGANWTQQYYVLNQNPAHIYMFNRNVGYMDASGLMKTTNSGLNWFSVSGGGFLQMFFIDSLTGWKCNLDMKKTTDGGLNWVNQPLPTGGNILISQIIRFNNVIRDTIWGVGAVGQFPTGARGLIYKSTVSGQSWGYQNPDTSIHSGVYQHIQFTDPLKGWAYWPSGSVHTTNGGDTVWYFGIQQISNEIPKDFTLKQNYPNPFNPRTIIRYDLKKPAYVKITAYDILGKEAQKLVDQKQAAGEYQVDFMGKFSASGVYFYRMEVTDDKTNLLYTETRKMILLK